MNVKRLFVIVLILCGYITIYFVANILIDGYWIVGPGELEFDKTGQVGDFIGGVIGTIVSAGAFYLLYLTLNEQKKVFIEQKRAFEKERFESKFFELIKMHRDNVNELKYAESKYTESKPAEYKEPKGITVG